MVYGELGTIPVDARRRSYRWRLRRAGRTRPVASGRSAPGKPIALTAPSGDSGLFLLELREGESTSAVPLLVQSERRADILVVVPLMTWLGSEETDDEGDGIPNTLANGGPVRWPRVLARGLPEDLRESVAPLLVFLDRAGIRYDITSDLDLALSRSPRTSDRKGVLLAGSERWVPRAYARRLRRYALEGGRVASLGTDSMRRGLTLRSNGNGTAGELLRPTQPTATDPFGARLFAVRRAEGDPPPPLELREGDPDYGLLEATDGVLEGFSVLEESAAPGGRARLLAGLAQQVGEDGSEPAPPEPRFALTATRFDRGLVIRVGLPQWSARLADPDVAQITRNIADLLRGVRPRKRSTG